jgi:hypothetical protein
VFDGLLFFYSIDGMDSVAMSYVYLQETFKLQYCIH